MELLGITPCFGDGLMDRVAHRSPGGVEVSGWDEPGDAVAHRDLPVTEVDLGVVRATEQDPVLDGGRAAVAAEDHVVRVAPGRGTVTAREGAPSVAGAERAALGGGEEAAQAGQLEHSA